MSEDPRLGMFLDEWEDNVRKGRTVASLHEALTGHIEDDKAQLKEIHGRIGELDKAHAVDQAYERGQKSGGEFGSPERTGRFPLPPNGIAVATPPPFASPLQPLPPLVEVHVDSSGRRRKTSIPPAVSRLLHSRAVQLVLAALVSAIIGWASRHEGLGAPSPPPPVLVPVPAPTPASPK